MKSFIRGRKVPVLGGILHLDVSLKIGFLLVGPMNQPLGTLETANRLSIENDELGFWTVDDLGSSSTTDGTSDGLTPFAGAGSDPRAFFRLCSRFLHLARRFWNHTLNKTSFQPHLFLLAINFEKFKLDAEMGGWVHPDACQTVNHPPTGCMQQNIDGNARNWN